MYAEEQNLNGTVVIVLMWNTFAMYIQSVGNKEGRCSFNNTVRRKKIYCLQILVWYIVVYKLNFWSFRMNCWRMYELFNLEDCYMLRGDSAQITRNVIHKNVHLQNERLF